MEMYGEAAQQRATSKAAASDLNADWEHRLGRGAVMDVTWYYMIVWKIHIQYIRSQKRSFKLNIGISGCRLRRVAKSVSTCVNSSGSAAEEATERFMAGIEPRFDLVLQDMWTKKKWPWHDNDTSGIQWTCFAPTSFFLGNSLLYRSVKMISWSRTCLDRNVHVFTQAKKACVCNS